VMTCHHSCRRRLCKVIKKAESLGAFGFFNYLCTRLYYIIEV
jgi:hypothetical protein